MNQKKDYVLRWIPKYSIIPLITALVLNTLVYSGTMVLCTFRFCDQFFY